MSESQYPELIRKAFRLIDIIISQILIYVNFYFAPLHFLASPRTTPHDLRRSVFVCTHFSTHECMQSSSSIPLRFISSLPPRTPPHDFRRSVFVCTHMAIKKDSLLQASLHWLSFFVAAFAASRSYLLVLRPGRRRCRRR